MRWPFARTESEGLRQAEEGTREATSESHRSPGLEAALSHLDEGRPCHVLDLGPAMATSVAFFAHFPCRLRIVDLLGWLVAEPEISTRLERDPALLFAELLPHDARPVDLVLAWNVFDHLPRDAARQLALRLARVARSGARLYALIRTSRQGDTGLAFAIRDRANLDYRAAVTPANRAAPFNPASFEQLLSGFAVDHSFVLRHGYQEYVAVRSDDESEMRD